MLRQTEEDVDKGNVQQGCESGVLEKKLSTAIKDGEGHRANIHG